MGQDDATCFLFLFRVLWSTHVESRRSEKRTFLLTVVSHLVCETILSSYVIVYRPENLLRRNQQARHLPDGHLKVHLGKLEQSVKSQTSNRQCCSSLHFGIPNLTVT